MLKGTMVQVWFYIAEPKKEKALEEVERVIDNGLKHERSMPNIKYVAEVLN